MLSRYDKNTLLTFVILVTWFFQFYLTQKLWIHTDSEFPSIQLFSFLPIHFPHLLQTLLVWLTFLPIALLIWKPEQKKFLLFFLFPSLLLVMEDNLRLQPWFFLHLSMIVIITFEEKIQKENVTRFIQWIIIAIYFWGGVNKLNIAFAWEIFPWFTQHLGIGDAYFLGLDNLNAFPLPAKNYIAFLIPAFEILIAVFLIFPKCQKIGIAGVIVTHLVSLYAIGPWGHNWNEIVWPWNIEMPILTFLAFRNIQSINQNHWTKNFQTFKTKTGVVIMILFFLLPFLGLFGYHQKALSLHLYSGNSDELEFRFEGYDEKLASTSMAEHLYIDTTTLESTMKVEYWVIEQTGVPMYNSYGYFRKIGKHLCNCLDHPEKGGIWILRRSGFSSQQDTIRIPCKDL